MPAQVPWEKLLRYGESVLNAASQAWERVRTWRPEREKLAAVSDEPAAAGKAPVGLDQLSEALAAQSDLTKRLAEQANDLTKALSELALRVSQVEQQNKQHVARMREAVASQAVRSRWAMTIAALALVLAGLLAVLPYFR